MKPTFWSRDAELSGTLENTVLSVGFGAILNVTDFNLAANQEDLRKAGVTSFLMHILKKKWLEERDALEEPEESVSNVDDLFCVVFDTVAELASNGKSVSSD